MKSTVKRGVSVGAAVLAIAALSVLAIGWKLAGSGDAECIQLAGREGIESYGVENDVRWLPPGWTCRYYNLEGELIETRRLSLFF